MDPYKLVPGKLYRVEFAASSPPSPLLMVWKTPLDAVLCGIQAATLRRGDVILYREFLVYEGNSLYEIIHPNGIIGFISVGYPWYQLTAQPQQ